MVKPEKFGHLHLVYHFTVPLKNSQNSQNRARISESICNKIAGRPSTLLKKETPTQVFSC